MYVCVCSCVYVCILHPLPISLFQNFLHLTSIYSQGRQVERNGAVWGARSWMGMLPFFMFTAWYRDASSMLLVSLASQTST